MASIIRTHPRKIAGGVALVAFFASPYSPNLFRSYGVQNVEKAYSGAGGSPNHLPASASPLGKHEHVQGNLEEHKGMGSPQWEERIAEQKPEGSRFDKTWNKAQYGTEKGK